MANKKTPNMPDIVQVYIDDVSRHDMISRKQEFELATTLREHSKQIVAFEKAEALLDELTTEVKTKPDNKTLRNKLASAKKKRDALWEKAAPGLVAREVFLKANLRLVIFYAHKFNGWSELDLPDLIQEGNLGLMKALEKFDPDRGFKFSTYASWWIKQAMNRADQKLGNEIRIPAHRLEHVDKLAEGRGFLQRKLDRDPTWEELEEYLDISIKKLQEADTLPKVSASIWSPLEDTGDTRLLEETLGDEKAHSPEIASVESNVAQWVKKNLSELPPRDYDIFKLRYGFEGEDPHSLEQIGKKVGLTRERVRQILRKWHDKFLDQAKKDGIK